MIARIATLLEKGPMPHRLLLVDDEAHNRKLLRMVLRQGEYEFSEAENGTQALEILAKERIDLVLLDLMMPSPERVRRAPRHAEERPEPRDPGHRRERVDRARGRGAEPRRWARPTIS